MCDLGPGQRHASDDGTGGDDASQLAKDEAFARWFHENGGSYPKIEWPSRDTVGAVRGTTAKEDIGSGEPMLFVPQSIMISPPVCHAHPELGPVFSKHRAFFARDDDTMLAVFVMYERARGPASFWHPYLDMLPWPGSIADWDQSELEELQDLSLMQDAIMRPVKIKAKYDSLMGLLVGHHPELFSREVHTLHRFTFAWMSIQARAFGRRLPWTALVPFADCLNHTNVATKYDFDVEGTGMFRLMPTGDNCYPKGSEVFNSYGRRNNRFLLMEYGFALEKNEWDTCSVTVELSHMGKSGKQRAKEAGKAAGGAPTEGKEEGQETTAAAPGGTSSAGSAPLTPDDSAKLALLRKFSISGRRQFRLRWGRLNQDLMSFCRLKAMTGAECSDRHNALRFWSDGVSVANEIKAQDVYIAEMRARLARFATTMEEDEAILAASKAGSASPRLVAATRYRHCKKRILKNHIALVEALQPLMGLLKEQESRDLDPTDPRGLQVHYTKAYLNKLCIMASRGPSERKRLEEEERRERLEREARRAHAARMEELRRQEEEARLKSSERVVGGEDGVLEEKSRYAAGGSTGSAVDYSTEEEGAYETADEDGVSPSAVVVNPRAGASNRGRMNPYGAGAAGNAEPRPVAPAPPQVEEIVVDQQSQNTLTQLRHELAKAQAEHAAVSGRGDLGSLG
eukprot:g2193.t1